MQLVRTPADLRAALAARPPTASLGFVPTMGGLHAGHGALVDACVRECDCAVVSLFVNPAQFAPGEDLAAYPRTEDADLRMLRAAGVSVVFAPPPDEVYPPGYTTYVTTGVGSAETNPASEGASRPTFFRGVATVVAKLLVLVRPDRAYFGRKDAQQCAVVKRMVEDLWLGVTTRVVCVDTVREKDGLAMSSRNVYLTGRERAAAPVIYRALCAGRKLVDSGERDAMAVRAAVRAVLDEWAAGGEAEGIAFEVLYVSVCCAEDMRELEGRMPEGVEVLACVALKMGKTRLIDNVLVQTGE
jgi:pantoate--beta-alanine ligase